MSKLRHLIIQVQQPDFPTVYDWSALAQSESESIHVRHINICQCVPASKRYSENAEKRFRPKTKIGLRRQVDQAAGWQYLAMNPVFLLSGASNSELRRLKMQLYYASLERQLKFTTVKNSCR